MSSNSGPMKKSRPVGCGCFQEEGSSPTWESLRNKISLNWLAMRNDSSNFESDCRISLGSCELSASQLPGKPIVKTSARDDSGRDDLRLRRSSMRQGCWLVPCMSISIQCEQPWLCRPRNHGSPRLTIGLPRSEGLYRPPLLGSTNRSWTGRMRREGMR